MVYVPDDPEEGEAFVIPLVEQCPKMRAVFEAIRHGLPAPDLSDCDNDSEQPQPTRSKFTSSAETSTPSSKHSLPPFQDTVIPPTDAECGLPSAISVALSEIPTERLPLSRALASSHAAAVINGHTRREFAESLAYAANLRRATGHARAILVIASSENAVREWISAMCEVLDEVQLISYSRARTKRDATLLRLRQAQYPGIIIAAEKTLKDGARELWEMLRENRVLKKWEVVVSEAVTDKRINAECSPLRMVCDGLAEKGVIIGREGLTKRKACSAAKELRDADVENSFWLSKEDIQKLALAESEKHGEGLAALQERDNNKLADAKAIKPKARRTRLSRTEKENHLLPGNTDTESKKTPALTKSTAQQDTPATEKSRRKRSDSVRKRNSKGPSPKVDKIVDRNVSGGVVKSRKKKDIIPRAKVTKEKITNDVEEALSKLEKTKAAKKTSQRSKNTASKKKLSDSVRMALLQDVTEERVKRTASKTTKSLETPVQAPPRRRKSSRLSSTLSSSEPPTNSTTAKLRSRKRQSNELRNEQKPLASKSTTGKKRVSKSLASLSRSGVSIDVDMSSSEDKTWSLPTRENFEGRARALRLHSLESSSSSGEKFYTPPSHAPTPPSKNTTPEKYVSSCTSASPTKPIQFFTEPTPRPRKIHRIESALLRKSCSPLRKSQNIKNMAPRPHKSPPEVFYSPRSSISPVKRNCKLNEKRRLDMGYDSSDDQPLLSKMSDLKRRAARRAVKADLTPSVMRNFATHSSSDLASAAERLKDGRRVSVFEGLLPAEPSSKNADVGIRRTKSFPAPIHMKREESPPPRGFVRTLGNSRYHVSRTTSRRRSLPISSPDVSICPVKSELPEKGKTRQQTPARAVTPRHVAKEMRSTSRGKFSNAAPRRKAPANTVLAKSSPAEPEVIVINSDTEDEETPRSKAVSKNRRISNHGECSNDLRDVILGRSRNAATTSEKETLSSVISRTRNRARSGSGSQVRVMRRNNGTVSRENLGSFIRQNNRNRSVKDLPPEQQRRFCEFRAEGKRFEDMRMPKEALLSYEKCLSVHDGDSAVINRVLELASDEGRMRTDVRRATKSPIEKRSRRRRYSGRKARPERSNSRTEVIDLTNC